MEIKGTVSQLLAEQSGSGSGDRAWRKQELIIDIPGNYKRQVCISLWGDNIDNYKLAVGDEVIASIDIDSREYNGRWYTNVKAWKIVKGNAEAAPSSSAGEVPWDAYAKAPTDLSSGDQEDDLPF